jgi:trehalose-phosphatase
MSESDWPGLPRHFWDRVTRADSLLLALDYDGTLAPIHASREAAFPLPGMVRSLQALSANPAITLAVLSGRPVSELLSFLASGRQEELARIQLIGEHGWERLQAGSLGRHALPPHLGELLRRAEQEASDAGFAALLERKRTAVVLHTRGQPPDAADRLRADARSLWLPLADGSDLRLDEIDGGLELRAFGRNKGTALRELLAESVPGTLLVYVGDDKTDEDAFQQVAEHGFGLRVARQPAPTLASGSLDSCETVLRWLDRLNTERASRSTGTL